MNVSLQPLRIPSGWRVGWNTFFELDPTVENVAAGFFCGSSLFTASSENWRLAIDLEWYPEDDPNGAYYLTVVYAPWKRTEAGRRRHGPLDFRGARLVHEFCTKDRAEIVRELETVFCGRDEWVEHN